MIGTSRADAPRRIARLMSLSLVALLTTACGAVGAERPPTTFTWLEVWNRTSQTVGLGENPIRVTHDRSTC